MSFDELNKIIQAGRDLKNLTNGLVQEMKSQFLKTADDKAILTGLIRAIKAAEKGIQEQRVLAYLLEADLVNVACNDPGQVIAKQLVLPMLRERLDREASKIAQEEEAAAKRLSKQAEVCTPPCMICIYCTPGAG